MANLKNAMRDPSVMGEVAQMMKDPENMAALKKMMADPNFQAQAKRMQEQVSLWNTLVHAPSARAGTGLVRHCC